MSDRRVATWRTVGGVGGSAWMEYEVKLSKRDRETPIYLYIDTAWPENIVTPDFRGWKKQRVENQELAAYRDSLEKTMGHVIYQLDTQKILSASWLRMLILGIAREQKKRDENGY